MNLLEQSKFIREKVIPAASNSPEVKRIWDEITKDVDWEKLYNQQEQRNET